MNNKGASLIEIIGVIVIIGIIGTIAVPGVSKYILNSRLTTFLAYEDSMEDAAKNAVLDCIGNGSLRCDVPSKDESNDISLKYLIDEGFIDDFTTPSGGSCNLDKSFVRVIGRGNLNYKFKVCLYCDDYNTDDDICSVE